MGYLHNHVSHGVIDCFRLALIGATRQPVGRAADAAPAPVEDMGVDHRRANVLVAEQFLDGADVVTVRQEMCGKRMPKGVAGDPLGQPGFSRCRFQRPLKQGFVDVMTALLAGLGVSPAAFLRVSSRPKPFVTQDDNS